MKKFLSVLENLTNAFRMPDGASEMTRNLASLDFPQLTSVLPYRDYDRDSGLFVNRSTVGFLLRAEPLIGANEQIVYVLEDLIKSKLPRKTPISFHLVSSKLIGDQLDRGLSEFRWQGKRADKFNRITRAYYRRAAQQQFNSPTGLPLTLRDYRLYISYCVKARKRTAAVMTEVAHTLKVLRSSLDAAKIFTQTADAQELATLVHGMLNARHDQLYPDDVRVGKFDELHQRCIDQRTGAEERTFTVLEPLRVTGGRITEPDELSRALRNVADAETAAKAEDPITLPPDEQQKLAEVQEKAARELAEQARRELLSVAPQKDEDKRDPLLSADDERCLRDGTEQESRELDEAVREAVAGGRGARQQVREQMQRTEREWVVKMPEKEIELEKTLGGD